MNLGLEGRVALVTGASKGLGRAVACALAAEGTDVALTARSTDLLSAVAAGIERETGRRALPVPADAALPGEPERAVADTLEAFGRLDILVNTAGTALYRPLEQTTEQDWYEMFNLNLMAAVRFCWATIGHLKERRWGRIVNVVGTSAGEPEPGVYASTATKAGVFSLTKSLSIDLAPYGITVNLANPGRIVTERTGQNYTPERMAQFAAARIPVGRFGQPEEFAPLVAFLCSEQARYITGVAVAVDGGMRRCAY